MGYTLEAIREALAEAGVTVSKSTVQREVARQSRVRAAAITSDAAASHGQLAARPQAPAALESPAPAAGSAPIVPEGSSAKETAEVFMRSQITNPLIRAKEQR